MMARTDPADTFAKARGAITNGDWDACFATLDRDDQMKIAANGANRLVGQGPRGAGVLYRRRRSPVAVSRVAHADHAVGLFKLAGTTSGARSALDVIRIRRSDTGIGP
jgi:hypothetical protein